MSVVMRGLAETVAKLREIGEEGERITSREVVASALNVQGNARRILTYTDAVDTGRLRNSIAVAEAQVDLVRNSDQATGQEPGQKRGGAAGGLEAPNAVRAGMLNAVIGSNVHYAPEIHFGRRGMAARPYLVPAVEEERPKLLERLARALRKLESA